MGKNIMNFLKVAANVLDTGVILDTSGVLDVRQVLNTNRVLGGVGELLDRGKAKGENDPEDDAQDFITLSNNDATNDKEKREQKNALRVIGNRYLQYLAALDPNSTEAQALLSHSGFNSMATLIATFKNGSGGVKLTLKFSTHNEKSGIHESAGFGQFYIHPDGYGDITGIGAIYLSNTITISKDIYYLYKYMASREYINIKLDGQPFDYDVDISKGFDFISQILEHETCHWGADWNGPRVRPPEFFDDNNTIKLLINGIQQGQNDNTWELGQHFEWAAWGRRNPVYNESDSVELRYGAAVNIHYKLMSAFPCELNKDNAGNIIKPAPEQVQQIKDSIYTMLANYYPESIRIKPDGEKDGGYNPSSMKIDVFPGSH